MGYYTAFNGEIRFKSKYAFSLFELILNNKIEVKEDSFGQLSNFDIEGFGDDINFAKEDLRIDFNGSWKDSGFMANLCHLANCLDKNAEGNVEASGEESGDLWNLEIHGGKVLESVGVVTYPDATPIESELIEDQIKKILKDERIKSLVVLEAIDG